MARADRSGMTKVLLFIAGYVVAAQLAFQLAYVSPIVAPIWPSTGLAIAYLLLAGRRMWPAVFAAAFLANLGSGHVGPGVALGVATGNTLEAVLAVYLIRRWIGPGSPLAHPGDVLLYVLLAGLVAPVPSATLGVVSLCLGGYESWTHFAGLWMVWWQGDMGGAIVVAPAILAVAEAPRPRPGAGRIAEGLLLALATAFTTVLAFGLLPFRRYPIEYLPLALLVLATFRFGRVGAAIGSLVVLYAAVWEAALETVSMSAWRASQELLLLQLYTEVVAITTLLLAAVVTERGESQRQLRESNARLSAQMEAALDGILTIDEHRRVIGFNKRFTELWAIPDELMRTFSDNALLAYVRPLLVDWPAFIGRIEYLYAHPEERSRDEIHLVDGRILDRWSAPVVSPDGRHHGRIWYFRDVTERIALEDALRRQNTRLQEVDRLKSNLVSAVSHELRTPLTSIVGYAEFLEDELAGPLTPGQVEQVHMIQAGARTLQRLVDDLLDFARMESGQFRLERDDADLAAKVGEVVAAARPMAIEAGVELSLAAPPTAVTVSMDAQRIGQVIANLINNALKFTPAGGRVTLTVRVEGGVALVEVADTGVGIAAEHLPFLFDRFYQVDAGLTRSKGGAGLGLAICRAIVEAHGGQVGVITEPGSGSRFYFTLPLAMARAV